MEEEQSKITNKIDNYYILQQFHKTLCINIVQVMHHEKQCLISFPEDRLIGKAIIYSKNIELWNKWLNYCCFSA